MQVHVNSTPLGESQGLGLASSTQLPISYLEDQRSDVTVRVHQVTHQYLSSVDRQFDPPFQPTRHVFSRHALTGTLLSHNPSFLDGEVCGYVDGESEPHSASISVET